MPLPRSASSASPKSAAPRPQKPVGKGAASPRLDANEVGVKRRANQRARRRRNNWLAWSFLVVATVVLSGALGAVSGAGGVWKGASGIWKEYQGVQQKIAVKQATLDDLHAQLDRKQRRVSALDKPEGKERALVEGGYLGKDERFLLFPHDKTQAEQADKE